MLGGNVEELPLFITLQMLEVINWKMHNQSCLQNKKNNIRYYNSLESTYFMFKSFLKNKKAL